MFTNKTRNKKKNSRQTKRGAFNLLMNLLLTPRRNSKHVIFFKQNFDGTLNYISPKFNKRSVNSVEGSQVKDSGAQENTKLLIYILLLVALM